MLEENLRDWHRILSKILWAYRNSKRSSKRSSPFSLTYELDVVLPIEVVVPSLRVSRENGLTPQEYCNTPKDTLVVVNMFRVFCRHKLKFL